MTAADRTAGPSPADVRPTAPADVIAFLGLTDVAELDGDGDYAFGPGPLYPHTRWLSSVLDRFATTADEHPRAVPLLLGEVPRAGAAPLDEAARVAVTGYLVAIDALQDHTAFAPGPTGERVRDAGRRVASALAPTRAERRRR
jgi:hypothetical protein